MSLPSPSLVRKIFLPVLVLAGGAGLAYLVATSKPDVEREVPAAPPPLITVVEARRADIPLDVVSQGTVEPRTESTLVAQVSGRILSVSADFAAGAFVSAGQVLVRIDPADWELAVEQARAQVAAAEVRLRLEEAEAELAVREWRDLGSGGEPSPLAAREPQVQEARAMLGSARARLAQAELDLERTAVRAPFTGRLRAKQADLGQFVSPGTPLATLFATDWAEIRLPVPKDQLAFLELDLESGRLNGSAPAVRLRAEIGGRARSWPATLVRTSGILDARTRMLDLYARIDDPYGRLRATREREGWNVLPMGLFVEAAIAGRVAEGAFEVPRVALRPDGRLMVVDTDDRLRFRDIEVIRIHGDTVVVGSGLDDGARIPVSPLETPVDGMKVRTVLADQSGPRTAAPEEVTL